MLGPSPQAIACKRVPGYKRSGPGRALFGVTMENRVRHYILHNYVCVHIYLHTCNMHAYVQTCIQLDICIRRGTCVDAVLLRSL